MEEFIISPRQDCIICKKPINQQPHINITQIEGTNSFKSLVQHTHTGCEKLNLKRNAIMQRIEKNNRQLLDVDYKIFVLKN